MKNIQAVSDSFLCSNCGACAAVCPKDSITFHFSSLGRLISKINDNCIACGLCWKVCPSIDEIGIHNQFDDTVIGNIQNTYIGHSLNEEYYANAQSGGVATTLLAFLFQEKRIDAAVVCKMSSGKVPTVSGIVVTNENELMKTQRSCYTPVSLLTALKDTVGFHSVAIVGLPCHLQGVTLLQNALQRFKNVQYKIGLICDRTLCNAIQDAMIHFACPDTLIEFPDNLIVWRHKMYTAPNGAHYSYETAPVVVKTTQGEEYVVPRRYRMALKEMFTAPRCRVCADKLCVHADLVLGDPWEMPEYDKEHGDSLILTRTPTGQKLLDNAIASGCLTVSRQPDYKAVLTGQAINARRKKAAVYSAAFHVLDPQTELPETSKDDKESHGYGLMNMKRITEKYYGTIQLEQREDMVIFTALLMIPE